MPTTTGHLTHFDLPGICTDGQQPVPGLHPYDAPHLYAGDVQGAIDGRPDETWCVHYGSTRTVLTTAELDDWTEDMEPELPLYFDHLHTVPNGTPQRPQDLWLLRNDARTGAVSADSGDFQPWQTAQLTTCDGRDEDGQPLHSAAQDDPELRRRALSAALEATKQGRQSGKIRDRTALAEAVATAEAAAVAHLQMFGTEAAPEHLATWTSEALDRAYGLARIHHASADLDDPEVPSSYQDFYRLGFPPPTHQEMADHIVRNHGRRPLGRIARALRRLLGVPAAPWQPLPPTALRTA